VTFSGGEPLLHASEINELAAMLNADGIGYALDTSGCVDLSDDVKTALQNADMVICDVKFWDDESYLKYTGRDMSRTLKILEYCNEWGKRILARTVIVPTINDTPEHIAKYCEIIGRFKSVFKYELLGFHTMGFFKYENLGIANPLEGYEQMDVDALAKLQKEADRILK
jgi:pyruvate formate lyase activating enzyme